MAIKTSEAVRNAKLNAQWTVILAAGAAAKVKLKTLAPPATIGGTPVGTLCATITLPASPVAAAATGEITKTGTAWTDANPPGGTPGHFIIEDQAGVVHMMGTAGIAGSGPSGTDPDMVLTSASITAAVPFTLSNYLQIAGNP